MKWTVRKATADDAAELARINVAAWRCAYRGIVPENYLNELDAERRRQGWLRWLAQPEPDAVFVATAGETGAAANGGPDRLVAYAAVAAAREARDVHPMRPTGELAAIYADPMVWRTGAGHAVHEAAVAAMAGFGFRHAVLWVFEDNQVARDFYRRHGWRCDEVREVFEVAGQCPVEVRYSRGL